MNLLLFILACWGMTQILVYGKIFDRIRPTHEFFRCTMCVGFHVGWFVFLLFRMMGMWAETYPFAWALLAGCISSATSAALCDVFSDGLVITLRRDHLDTMLKEVEEMSQEDLLDEYREIQS